MGESLAHKAILCCFRHANIQWNSLQRTPLGTNILSIVAEALGRRLSYASLVPMLATGFESHSNLHYECEAHSHLGYQ